MSDHKGTFGRLDILANPKSDRVKKIAGLSRRSVRKKYGSLLVEGVQSFKELIADDNNAKYIKDIYMSTSFAEKNPSFFEKANDLTFWVHLCTNEVIEAMSKDAQGIICVLHSTLFKKDFEDFNVESLQTVVLLPDIQDPGNLGTIIRSADAFKADLVVICKNSVDVTSPKVLRSCAGSIFHIPVIYDVDFKETVRMLKKANISIIGAGCDKGAISLENLVEDYYERSFTQTKGFFPLNLENPLCWVFGNEAKGLSAQEKDMCHEIVKIDMPGLAESLNVSVAASICLHSISLVKSKK